jgi:integrase
MAQRGRIHKTGTSWFLTYREPRIENGKRVMRQVVKKLAPVSDKYRTKKSVEHFAEEILGPINARTTRPESTQGLAAFLEHYLEHCRTNLRPCTVNGYRNMYKLAKPHLGNLTLHDFRTPEAQRLMHAATADKQRAHTTHRNLKSFLSGAFKYAKRTGAVNENPIRDVEIPRGLPKKPRAAYTLDEISDMLDVLPEPSRTVVLVAGLTGLRLSELKGLMWSDFENDTVMIQRSVWSGRISETKTLSSKAAVPIVPQVHAALEEHRKHHPGTAYVFEGGTGKPIYMESLFRDQMRKRLADANIKWRGWHPFRSGVGSTLHELGVDIKLIQQILRHSDQRMTLDFYVKPTGERTRKAMLKLGRALGKSLARQKRA